MDELKKCPFCGSEAEKVMITEGGKTIFTGKVHCSKPMECWLADFDFTVEEWQSRPIEDALREALKECLQTIHQIQGSYKGSIGGLDTTYLPQLDRRFIDPLAEKISRVLQETEGK